MNCRARSLVRAATSFSIFSRAGILAVSAFKLQLLPARAEISFRLGGSRAKGKRRQTDAAVKKAVRCTVDGDVGPADGGAAGRDPFGFGAEIRIEADDLRCGDRSLVRRRPALRPAEIGAEAAEDGPRLAATRTMSRTPLNPGSKCRPVQSIRCRRRNFNTPERVCAPRNGPPTFTRWPRLDRMMAELPVSPPGTRCVSSIPP